MTESPDQRLLAKLQELANRHDELNRQLSDPAIASDPAKSQTRGKELGKLRRLVEPYVALRKVGDELAEASALADDASQERELRDLAREEVVELERRYADQLGNLRDRLVTDDDDRIESIILEIRAGTGGDEAALFVRDLYEMYQRYCERQKFRVEVIDQSATDLGGFREIVLNIKGPGVYRHLGYEGGGHRVQRVPDTESQGRIHTSAVTVAVLPEPEDIDININWDTEVEEFVSRSGGPGGQNVNKVSSAIRLCHKETGITVSMRDEKSQHKNRAKARRLMTTRVFNHFQQAAQEERSEARKTMIGSGDRSQRIRTYNFPQNRCTDHRINLDIYALEKIMQGNLEVLVSALQTHDKQKRLENL